MSRTWHDAGPTGLGNASADDARGGGGTSGLEDVVLFDVPRCAAALYHGLRTERLAWLQFQKGCPLVAVPLGADPRDLAELLRDVEARLAELGVRRMRFELDGRAYSLRVRG